MNFEYSDRAREVRDAVADFMEEHVYPNEEAMLAQIEEGERFAPIPLLESLKRKAKSRGSLESLSAGERARGGTLQPRVRARLRGDGPLRLRPRGLQLLRPRHRQHGSAGALRHRGAEGAVARAPARGRDPVRLRDDRAGRRVVGRDQRRDPHRTRRGQLRHQRAQVVDLGRPRPALPDPDRDGEDRSREREPLPAAVHDPRADALARAHRQAHAAGLRLRRRAARPRRARLRGRPGARLQHPPRGRAGLRDRAGPARSRGASTTACARSGRRSARSSACAGARACAPPSASPSPTRA